MITTNNLTDGFSLLTGIKGAVFLTATRVGIRFNKGLAEIIPDGSFSIATNESDKSFMLIRSDDGNRISFIGPNDSQSVLCSIPLSRWVLLHWGEGRQYVEVTPIDGGYLINRVSE